MIRSATAIAHAKSAVAMAAARRFAPWTNAIAKRVKMPSVTTAVHFAQFTEDSLTMIRWRRASRALSRSEEHTSELQSLRHIVCRLLLEKNTNRRVRTTSTQTNQT